MINGVIELNKAGTFFRQIKNIGILIVSAAGEVIFDNGVSGKLNGHHQLIIDEALAGTTYFCIYQHPSEVQIFQSDGQIIVLINIKKDFIQLKEEHEALRLIQNEMNQVINSSFDGIVISDHTGKILLQNPSYEKITGLSAKDCIGRNLRDLEEEGVINSSASLRAIKENRDVTIIQKINTGVTVLVSAVPIRDKDGRIMKVVNNVRDLTHLKMLEKEVKELEKENEKAYKQLAVLQELNNPKLSTIAHSNEMKQVVERTVRVAQIDSVVLIQGESGVGKEKIVDLIHHSSTRKNEPLIKVNCGAIPESLLESELFGYAPGAFTGANTKGKAGLFEAANNGTIFLDEIGEMPLTLQVRLLRVLQEFEITRVGGTKPIPVNVRVIAATNRDLQAMVMEGSFREDLYYRLNIIPIYIPPLRERREDIIPLVYHFLTELKRKYGISSRFTKEALNRFYQYHWSGNVRELQNVVERVTLMSGKPEIDTEDIQKEMNFSIRQMEVDNYTKPDPSTIEIRPLKEHVEKAEIKTILEALEVFPSIRKAATALHIDQSTLVRKMQKYKIRKKTN